MKVQTAYRLFSAFTAAAALALTGVAAGTANPVEFQEVFAQAAKRAKPAVVNITAVHEEDVLVQRPQFYFGDPEDLFRQFFEGHGPRSKPRRFRRQYEGAGSGALIDPRGYIVTNDHVIRGADEIKVTLTHPSGREKVVAAKVVAKNASMDLAVVKLQRKGNYPFLKLGDSDGIRVGDWAIAIGSPFRLQQTVTAGIISALRQSISIEGRSYHNIIQTDAAINRGNSGGPLLNLSGEIIGINTAIYTPSGAFAGIGFAISVNEAKEFIEAALEGREIHYGWLGVELGSVDEVMKSRFHLESTDGALVNKVIENSPASEAGLERGDVILKLDGDKITSPSDVVHLVRRAKPGEKVRLMIKRGGRDKTIPLKLGVRPEWVDVGEAGPSGSDPGGGTAKTFHWKEVEFRQAEEGVRVGGVRPDSPLYGYLWEGDLINGVNQTQISSVEEFERLAPKLDLAAGVVFDILRRNQPMYVSVQIRG